MKDLKDEMDRWSLEEIKGLGPILKVEEHVINSGKEEAVMIVTRELAKASKSLIGFVFSSEMSYKDMVTSLAERLKIKVPPTSSSFTIESRIVEAVLTNITTRMDDKQKKAFEKKLRETAIQLNVNKSILPTISINMIGAAALSGVGTYLLANVALKAVASSLGFILPLTASTSIGVAIGGLLGPIGWTGAALFTAWKLTGPNHKKMLASTLYIHMIRAGRRQ